MLAHLPPGKFTANAARLTLAVINHNLTRVLGCLTSAFHARARTGTICRQLPYLSAWLVTSARTLTFHLPKRRPWQNALEALWTAVCHRLRT
ncbi:hypothetical protein ACVW19_002955 [Streptomyces sp. TE5632]